MSAASLIALRGQLAGIARERALRGWLGNDLIGYRAKAKRLFVEAAVAEGINLRKAWDTANQCQDEAEREARQGELFTGIKEAA